MHLESDDEEAEVVSVDTMMSRSSAGMRRGGKRMEMIRPHLTQQQQQSINDEELYSDSDQEVETQSRTSGMMQVVCLSVSLCACVCVCARVCVCAYRVS